MDGEHPIDQNGRGGKEVSVGSLCNLGRHSFHVDLE